MSIVPNFEMEDRDDLCIECGRDNVECICGETLPNDFDPLSEEEWENEWGGTEEYEDYLDRQGDK